ncbi:MAG: phosphoribosylamine--glycine ligase [Micrococcales bacterium]|nr:phosphoribosylamine--glycine ligase [Micrococcales bacterium]MCL2668978.1 phosphoribosylamine--glycine ligase [Micrococcales bacterium]
METEAVALLVAAVSLLVAGLSLGWQMAEWLLSAGRPRATLLLGVAQGAGVYCGPVPKSGRLLDLDQFLRQGIDGPEVLGIQVTNHGRAPVTVDRVAVLTQGGTVSYVPGDDLVGPGLPCTVEPGRNNSWYVPLDKALALASASREAAGEPVTGVYMTALLGTGKAVRTRRTLRT